MITILHGMCGKQQPIKSSLFQTRPSNWRLIVQDDCSEDRTCEIVEKCAAMHPDRIVRNSDASSSAKDNYFSILQYADSDYILPTRMMSGFLIK